ncbi:MAG TPA: YicC/YloC family endoribonuclease, partial [Thermoanaerobaculia bacterium]|nr:YicC/YloC family endoribonuclease [Thermoanaerobaculia bacterium]
MTGFGRAERTAAGVRVAVELRSVNHRYLDLQLRLPEVARSSEPEIRRRLGVRLARGRVEVSVAVTPSAQPLRPRARLDLATARELLAQAAELGAPGAPPALELRDLVNVPGMVSVEPPEVGWAGEAEEQLLAAVDDALVELEEARRAEGARLAAALGQILTRLEAAVAGIERRRAPARADLLERHRRRVAELLGDIEIDEARLAQEAAVLAERSDVEEELQRLGGHLAQLREAMAAAGPVGKRLDFLAQEVHRELNTL